MTKLRAAIYARHSTDKQNASSSADQSAACEGLVRQLDAETVGIYEDPEVSGYRRDRPGLMRLLRDIEAGRIDVVVCEALDRIARDGEDISWLGKKLSYHRVRLFTHAEREIDDVKLAVAGLLGSMFLSNLRLKTFRGLKAAVLAGRLAGGRAYGYRKVSRPDDAGTVVAGIFEVVPEQAAIVRRIFDEFAAGRSSIQIATSLNADRIPGPRGGKWNASTIRGDPKKLVGILNNPLYRGKLVWGRWEWRKNPDSDRRERRYRIRDQAEWIEVDMPDLRIVDDALVRSVERELARRAKPVTGARTGTANRAKHLLSGLIKCGACGSNYILVGKDYYRCARNRERGTCDSRIPLKLAVVEDLALSTLQSRLLTPDLVRIFTEEFAREVERLTRGRDEANVDMRARLAEVDREIGALAQHFLAGAVSPMLARMLADREREKADIETALLVAVPSATVVLPHPTLLRRYEEKVASLREALNDEIVRADATNVLRSLIGSITVRTEADGRPVLDIEASTSSLIDFASETPKPPARGREGGFSSMAVVAGTGFEPVTFRL